MDLKALRCVRQELFQLGSRLGEMSCVGLCDRRLKFAMQLLGRIIFGCCNRKTQQKTTKNCQPELGPYTHSTPRFRSASHALNTKRPRKDARLGGPFRGVSILA